MAKDGNLYITLDDKCGPGQETSGFIWKYNTLAGTWKNVSPATGNGLGGICVDPQNPQRLIASSVNTYKQQYVASGTVLYGDRYYLTNDGGSTWQTIVPISGYNNNNITLDPNGISWIYGQTLHWGGDIEFDPFNSNKAWVTSGNGVYKCNDLNSLANSNTVNTWSFVAQGLEETVPYDMVSIPNGPLFTGIADYDGFMITDATKYTAQKYTPSSSKATGIAYATQNPSFIVRIGSLMAYSTNQGSTWTATATNKGTYGRLAVSADGSVIVHCPNGSTTTWWSNDNGSTWTASTGIAVSGAVPWADPVQPNIFYVYGGGSSATMYISTNFGVSFTSTGGSPGASGSTIIRTVLGYPGNLWVAMNNSGLKFSGDSGKTFNAIPNVTYCQAVAVGIINPAGKYPSLYIWGTIGGITGIFGSIDKGATWNRLNDDAHQYGGLGNGNFVYADNNVVGRYYYGTLGRGIVYGDLASPLPINLVSFSGSLINQGQTGLKWETQSETNNDYFDIERSIDGISFIKVGTKKSQSLNGISPITLKYTFIDDVSSLSGTIFYSLNQVDKDGKHFYSGIVSILKSGVNSESAEVFPNPILNNTINLKVQLATQKDLLVSIVNISGETVFKQRFPSFDAGNSLIKIADKKTFAKGIYLIQVIVEKTKTTLTNSKIIIQ